MKEVEEDVSHDFGGHDWVQGLEAVVEDVDVVVLVERTGDGDPFNVIILFRKYMDYALLKTIIIYLIINYNILN